MSIIIFSKPIHSGKTTDLMSWCKTQKTCSGILMPDIDGVRKIFDIEKQSYFDAECKTFGANEELVEIGKYQFYQSAFDRANQIIEEALSTESEFIVIDEIGMLEINQKGFYPSVKQLIDASNTDDIKSTIILAVRDVFVDEVVTYFHILNYTIVDSLSEL
jgi:nucleoside-triphosphatase THEP1